jgi:DNA polymerase III epsilon subunit-like protein
MTAVEGAGPQQGRIVFCDTETTGLRDDHEPWEIALIVRDYSAGLGDVEHLYAVRPDLRVAESGALSIGRYYQRTRNLREPAELVDPGAVNLAGVDPRSDRWRWSEPEAAAAAVARITAGAVLVGSNVQFDARMLSRWLRANGQAPAWHYRPVDVGAIALGYLRGIRDAAPAGSDLEQAARPDWLLPWSTDMLATVLGVSCPPEQRHTALGDARFVRDLYDQTTGTSR